ncbi:MAG: PIN domain-containing protein [Clostridia bacterium]|nr:PIN domain-containing protein [Clostridia bacterium]
MKYDRPYILDTNIVISLAKYDKVRDYKKLAASDNMNYYYARSIEKLYNMIERGEIIAEITPTILNEIQQGTKRFGPLVEDYIKNNKKIKLHVFSQDEIRLAYELRNDYFNTQTSSGEYAFHYDPNKFNGMNDAFIMAQASILGYDVITYDKHFTTRVFTIREVNKMFKQKHTRSEMSNRGYDRMDKIQISKPTAFVEMHPNLGK